MGRKLGEPKEQLIINVPVGGRKRADLVAKALVKDSRGDLLWELFEAAERIHRAGKNYDLETLVRAIENGDPLPDQLLKEAAVGRAAMAAAKEFEKTE